MLRDCSQRDTQQSLKPVVEKEIATLGGLLGIQAFKINIHYYFVSHREKTGGFWEDKEIFQHILPLKHVKSFGFMSLFLTSVFCSLALSD